MLKDITDKAFGKAVLRFMFEKYGLSMVDLLDKNFTEGKYPQIDYILMGRKLKNMLSEVKTEEELKVIDRVLITFTGFPLEEILEEAKAYENGSTYY